jgi:formylglycine-generating enzyme required for sulfatase activity
MLRLLCLVREGATIVRLRVALVSAAMTLMAACGSEESRSAARCAALDDVAKVSVPAGRVDRGPSLFEPEERFGGVGDVAAFNIDAHEVTNAQFAAFVAATHYVTVAEQRGANGAPNGGAVFDRKAARWRIDPAAQWRRPEGAGSTIKGRERYPVVMIAYEDAQAFAQWAGRRLPTENEWELAARGADPAAADRGSEAFDANGRPRANTWQGVFPFQDSGEDGFAGLAPVGCFSPGANGLYDMIGNVWEWTSDRYQGGPTDGPARVIKGGSELCAPNFCARYRSGSRQPGDETLGMSHIGFRTAGDGPSQR